MPPPPSSSNTQLLAQIKLRETQRQRDRLHQQYDAIEARAAAAPSPLERLRALHDGLRDLSFARKPLHPDVANLDVLYLADNLGAAPPGLVAERTALLERELAQGRLRAEFTYAFGRILSEWTLPASDEALAPPPEGPDPATLLWQAPPPLDTAWLDEAFRPLARALRPVVASVEEFSKGDAFAPVRHEEVVAVLTRQSRDPYALPAFRRQAGAVLNSTRQVHEYAGALTILLNNLEEWDWPAEGLSLRSVWARVKYRPYLDEDLITALFLQVLGRRWGARLKPLLRWGALREGNRPLFPEEPASSPTRFVHETRITAQAGRFMATIPEDGGVSEGPWGYGPDALLAMLKTIEGEVRFARTVAPDQPLFVVQADLTDFYPSVSHEALLNVLARLGVSERWLAFFRRFLTPIVRGPQPGAAAPARVRRGLPLEHAFADVFSECLLTVLDLHVYRITGTQLIRVVDDFWFLAPSRERAVAAWRQVEAFCKAAGLAVNAEKSGAVCIGEAAPAQGTTDGLPQGQPRWGLLRLQPDASWHIDEPAYARLEGVVREQLSATPSVLELVSAYNTYVNHIMSKLGLGVMLHGDHLRRMASRLVQTHQGLFRPDHGLAEEVRSRLRGSFADARLKERGLPEALLYWPITAGGLALTHPLLNVATYLRGRPPQVMPTPPTRAHVVNQFLRQAGLRSLTEEEAQAVAAGRPPAEPPTEDEVARWFVERGGDADDAPTQGRIDEVNASRWLEFYNSAVPDIEPVGPPTMPGMERLVTDFINRGSEVSGRRQTGLTPYWRWVVYSYGPSLLEALGTFRFLMTELVPLELILENRRSARWELETDGDDAPSGGSGGGGREPADDFPF